MQFSIFAKATFRKLQEKYRAPEWSQKRDPDFARACAVEMRVNISQEPLYTDIYRKNAAAQLEHPDQAPAFTPNYRKNSSVWTHCLGKKQRWCARILQCQCSHKRSHDLWDGLAKRSRQIQKGTPPAADVGDCALPTLLENTALERQLCVWACFYLVGTLWLARMHIPACIF